MLPHEPGLSTEEAKTRQLQSGLNVLPEKPKPSHASLFISQLKSPLIYILILAGLITVGIGHFSDALIIFTAVGINTFLGFMQERKASNALYALKHYVAHTTTAVRDGKRVSIDTDQLVPDDIVILTPGAKVPADGILIHANRLYIDESILTGESIAIKKYLHEEVFMGTTVSVGQAIMRISTTGTQTKMGAIALQIQEVEEKTPLQKQLDGFSKQLLIIVGLLILSVIIIGLIYGHSLVDIFVTAVALAVSSIPEGLIISLTVILAIGMQKILKRRGLVRQLSAAETLGGVTVICVDKTGTLTQGKMEVVEAIGNQQAIAQQMLIANDLDDPIVIAAFEWGKTILPDFASAHPRLDSIPFSSHTRCFVSLHQWSPEKNRLFVNGAPEELLDKTSLAQKTKKDIHTTIDMLTKQGMRIIGLAYKDTDADKKSLTNSDSNTGLTWVGMLAFSDPVRSGVKEALAHAHSAGIRTIVITGDYAKTSEFVLAELGITLDPKQIITGEEIRKLSIEALAQKVQTVHLCARTTPDEKLMIVHALKKNSEVVAMMGDGVNDAPALHEADIGIAVGEATDVAKESADLILLDSNFATIVAAIEEGRGIFENIRKVIVYLMCDAFAEIIVILGSIILGLPLAVTAVQILWINLVSDGFPNLALTVDPIRKDIMSEKPRPLKEQLVNTWMIRLFTIVCTTAGLMALAVFVVVYKHTGDVVLAQSMTFITLGFNSLVYVFSIRDIKNPFWRNRPFENKWLISAVIGGIALQIFPFLTTSSRKFFNLRELGIQYWVTAICISLVLFLIVEVFKFIHQFKESEEQLKNISK